MESPGQPTIRNYEITQPPTSGQVRKLLANLSLHPTESELGITPEATPFSPNPTPETVRFRIDAMRNAADNSAKVIGHTPDGASVNVSIAANPQTPATLSMVWS